MLASKLYDRAKDVALGREKKGKCEVQGSLAAQPEEVRATLADLPFRDNNAARDKEDATPC